MGFFSKGALNHFRVAFTRIGFLDTKLMFFIFRLNLNRVIIFKVVKKVQKRTLQKFQEISITFSVKT